MYTSQERLLRDIEILAEFNATPGHGVTRFSYSTEDAGARNYLFQEFRSFGLQSSIDAVGNIRATLPGGKPELPVIMVGSHIDTVRHGGKYDGVVGVVAGLEILRVLRHNGFSTRHPVQLAVFAEEEGSNFGMATVGSKAMLGHIGVTDLEQMRDPAGTAAMEVMRRAGYAPEHVAQATIAPEDVCAMLELHIEQSHVLDRARIPVGIVTAISGIRGYLVTFAGESNHAGATPMRSRKDPMPAAAKTIAGIRATLRNCGGPETVATVGRFFCYPNVMNAIPERVSFTVDIRDTNDDMIDAVSNAIQVSAARHAGESGVQVRWDLISSSRGVMLPTSMVTLLDDIVSRRGILSRHMVSGAVHDAAIMATAVDTGMVFIPCKAGRSHCPEECADIADVQRGTEILLEAVMAIDRS